jgi:hypothetical protein
MARTKDIIEGHLAKAQSDLKAYVTANGLDKLSKTAKRHNSNWRRLQAIISKLQHQLTSIEKRNRKASPGEKA